MPEVELWSLLPRLEQCALFAGLPESILVSVLWHAERVEFSPGEAIVQHAQQSNALIVLVEGLAAVTPREVWTPGVEAIAWVKPGESIGEVGILIQGPRTATVTAMTPSCALRIPASGFRELMSLHPQLGVQVSTLLARRLAGNMLSQRLGGQRGKLITVITNEHTPADPLLAALTAAAPGSVHTASARTCARVPDAARAAERMIATSQALDELGASSDFVLVSSPPDIDAAYARPLLQRSDLVLVAPRDDSPELRRRLLELAGERSLNLARLPFTAASAQAVFDRLGRPHEVSVFVPTTVHVDREIDPTQHLDRAKALFGDCFGGATVREAEGVWNSEDLGLVGERILVVSAACCKAQLNRHLEKVTSFLLKLKDVLHQEAMAMSVDGRLILL